MQASTSAPMHEQLTSAGLAVAREYEAAAAAVRLTGARIQAAEADLCGAAEEVAALIRLGTVRSGAALSRLLDCADATLAYLQRDKFPALVAPAGHLPPPDPILLPDEEPEEGEVVTPTPEPMITAHCAGCGADFEVSIYKFREARCSHCAAIGADASPISFRVDETSMTTAEVASLAVFAREMEPLVIRPQTQPSPITIQDGNSSDDDFPVNLSARPETPSDFERPVDAATGDLFAMTMPPPSPLMHGAAPDPVAPVRPKIATRCPTCGQLAEAFEDLVEARSAYCTGCLQEGLGAVSVNAYKPAAKRTRKPRVRPGEQAPPPAPQKEGAA